MSEPKWTPGPWAVMLIPGSYQRPAIICAGDKVVGSCLGDQLEPDKTGIGEATANAHLIATAPSLYGALVAVSDMLFARPDMAGILRPLMGPAEHAVFDAAKAALAKARGES